MLEPNEAGTSPQDDAGGQSVPVCWRLQISAKEAITEKDTNKPHLTAACIRQMKTGRAEALPVSIDNRKYGFNRPTLFPDHREQWDDNCQHCPQTPWRPGHGFLDSRAER